jgi:hypothetical protein
MKLTQADDANNNTDVAIIDKEGYYYIVDRQKELIKYKVCTRSFYECCFDLVYTPPRDSKVL